MQAPGFRQLNLSHPQNKYFQLFTNAELENEFIRLLETSINLTMESTDFNKNNNPILTVFISQTASFKISYRDNPQQYGSQFNAVVLLYNRMKTLNDMQKLICIVEEFVHYFWLEHDEIKTSRIVCSIIPGLTCDENGIYSTVG